MNKKLTTVLEFDKILATLKDFAFSAEAKEQIVNLCPSFCYDTVKTSISHTSEAFKILTEQGINPIIYFDNMEGIIKKLNLGMVLECGELLKLATFLRASRHFKSSIGAINMTDYIYLKELNEKVFINKNLEEDIIKDILSEDEVADGASQQLSKIRDSVRRANQHIKEKLQSMCVSTTYKTYLQESIYTVREGRFVLPVKEEYKSKITGLVHDRSDKGHTLYIEPIEILELNNKIKTLKIEETAEIKKILTAFTERALTFLPQMISGTDALICADILFAKAQYARFIKATEPTVNNYGYTNLISARHPLIEAEKVVPIDLSIGKGYNLLLITGPNTGGKTVALKTMGLLTLMALAGLFIPAENGSAICVFNDIFCDIGDEQSIQESLSTFSSHIRNIIDITNKLNEQSLVLLDELGAGTDPVEGSALALAICEFIRVSGAKCIITTHFSALKEYALKTDGVMGAGMQFDYKKLKPTYKIVMGVPGASYAFEISERLGLKHDIIEVAKQNVDKDKLQLDTLLKQAEAHKQEAEKERIVATEFKAKAQSEYDKLAMQTKKLEEETINIKEKVTNKIKAELQKYINEAENAVEEIKELSKEVNENSLLQAKIVKSKLSKSIDNLGGEYDKRSFGKKIKPEDLKINMIVSYKAQSAEILSLNYAKKQVTILVNDVKLDIDINDLCYASDLKQIKNTPILLNSIIRPSKAEINLIGQRVEPALNSLEEFLDNALLNNLTEVKIIHGFGTGALRKGVQEYLKEHYYEFRDGGFGEGERAVTIVTIK